MEKQTFTFPPHPTYKSVFAIVKTLSGTYVCPGWHRVPDGTTRDQIVIDMSSSIVETIVKPEEPKIKPQQWQVEGSKPGTKYTVIFNGNIWTCSCPANQFKRGDCKHIKVKKESENILI